MTQPMQPMVLDADGNIRFQGNPLVQALYAASGSVVTPPHTREDACQLHQLLGESLTEFLRGPHVDRFMREQISNKGRRFLNAEQAEGAPSMAEEFRMTADFLEERGFTEQALALRHIGQSVELLSPRAAAELHRLPLWGNQPPARPEAAFPQEGFSVVSAYSPNLSVVSPEVLTAASAVPGEPGASWMPLGHFVFDRQPDHLWVAVTDSEIAHTVVLWGDRWWHRGDRLEVPGYAADRVRSLWRFNPRQPSGF